MEFDEWWDKIGLPQLKPGEQMHGSIAKQAWNRATMEERERIAKLIAAEAKFQTIVKRYMDEF